MVIAGPSLRLVAARMDIATFDIPLPTGRCTCRARLYGTEFVVGLLNGEPANADRNADFNAHLARALSHSRKPIPAPPAISNEALGAIRTALREWTARWSQTPVRGHLDLQFDARGDAACAVTLP